MEDNTPDLDQGNEPELETVVPGAAAAEAELPDTDVDPDALPDEGETPKPEPKRKPSGLEKRVSEVVWQREEAIRRATEAERRAAYYQGLVEGKGGVPQGQQPAKDGGPPKQADFETYDEYIVAVARHSLKHAMAEERANNSKEAEAKQAATQQEATRQGFESRAEAFRATQPDFDFQELARNPDLRISQTMAEVVYHSADGPALAHYLGQNPDQASRIHGLTNPSQQIFELGQISARLAAPPPPPKPRPVSAAPAPITPVTGAAKAVEALTDNAPIGEWMRRRTAEVRKR